MSSLDLDFDVQMNHLESEWRRAYEEGAIARAEYLALSASPQDDQTRIEEARYRWDMAESKKARIMAKIDRLEDSMLGRDS